MNNTILKENIIELINNKNIKELVHLFETIPTIDIAEALEDEEDVRYFLFIFKSVDSEYTADFFSELPNEVKEKIINAFTDKELIEVLNNSSADDIVDSIQEMPANVVNRILKNADSTLRKDINTLLNYKDGTAGSVMTTEFIELKDSISVKDAIAIIRERGKDAETIYTIFVKDDKRNLVGTIDLDDLIFAKEDETLKEIMDMNFVTCHVNDDQEEVANSFKRYDLNAMAVLNKDNKLVGIITIDDVVDIIVEEATEDISRLNLVSEIDQPYLKTPIHKLVLKCVPWIIVLMILQVFSTMILSGFQSEIAKFAVLSVFTPLIMDAGGNSGGQTTTIIIRSLALQEFKKGDLKKVIWKELRVSACVAILISIFAFLWLVFEMSVGIVHVPHDEIPGVGVWGAKFLIAALVSITLFVTMIVSRMIGCLLPFIAKVFKRDPAVMCSPLTTTIVDIVSLLTYFVLWVYIFSPILGLK